MCIIMKICLIFGLYIYIYIQKGDTSNEMGEKWK